MAVDLLEMDAQRLDFPGYSFDAVVFTLCLCTIPDPDQAIREAVRVARPAAPIRMLEHGVEGLTEERWFLGLFTIVQGRAPAG